MTDVDRQIARSSEVLARTRADRDTFRTRRRRTGDTATRLVRIAVADTVIVIAAIVIGWFVPLGIGGAMLVIALLIAATLLLGALPANAPVAAEALAQAPLKALPSQTERWLDAQRPALPAPAQTLVDAIGVRLDTLGPQLAALDDRLPVAAEVRKLVGEQLPELVKDYVRVPLPLRGVARNGRSPDLDLADALRRIDREIGELSGRLAEGDIDQLATRSRFLEIKYQGDPTG